MYPKRIILKRYYTKLSYNKQVALLIVLRLCRNVEMMVFLPEIQSGNENEKNDMKTIYFPFSVFYNLHNYWPVIIIFGNFVVKNVLLSLFNGTEQIQIK